jgi:membrane protease YdiL (CAAX protease family)
MAKRTARGRGSGGRVTPSPRPSGGTARRGRDDPRSAGDPPRARGRVLRDDGRRSGGQGRFLEPGSVGRAPGEARPGRERPWWGFGDVLIWFLVGQVAALLLPVLVAQQGGYAVDRPIGPGVRLGEVVGRVAAGQAPAVTATWADMPLWLTQGVLLLPLWAAFVGGSVYATVRKGSGPRQDLKIAIRPLDVPLGVAVGLFAQLALNPLLYRLLFVFTGEQDVSAGARGITDKATSPLLVVLLFVTVGVVAPVAEELFFRGLALRSLIRRFGRVGGLLLSAAFFGAVHGNPLYFVALMPFAVVLGWLVIRFDRLGPAIAAHVAYNLVTATVLVFDVQVPW